MSFEWFATVPGASVLAKNAPNQILLAIGVFFGIVVLLQVALRFVAKRLDVLARRTRTKIDDAFSGLLLGIGPLLTTAAGLAVSARFLILPAPLPRIIDGFFVIALLLQSVRILERLMLYGMQRMWRHHRDDDVQAMSSVLGFAVRLVLWSLAALLLLANLGIDVTSLVASLGIGGIAIALAVQNILGDLLSSFSLYFDEPFRIGDFIVVGDHMGTVRKIGLKTTRIQALQGEEIVIPNRELTSVRVQNFKRMDRRRVEFSLGVVYDTTTELVAQIPSIIRDVFGSVEGVELDRVHFKSFGDSSLDFVVVYFVKGNDYLAYMDAQERINLGILGAFRKHGIDFAFPTRTVVVEHAA